MTRRLHNSHPIAVERTIRPSLSAKKAPVAKEVDQAKGQENPKAEEKHSEGR